jgi:hypothetical protein
MQTATAQTLGLELMLAELESHQLVTILVPQKRHTNEGGMIRVNMDRNCDWYRAFCAKHPSKRGVRRGKFDTIIRRQHVIRALTKLAEGKPTKSPYAPDLLKIAERFKP